MFSFYYRKFHVSMEEVFALGSIVGFSQYTANFYICIYLLYVTRTTCFGLSYFTPPSGPSITLLLALQGAVINGPEDGLK